jgi:Flp pilus assembly protein TadG
VRSKLSDLKSLYTTLGGESTDVLNANSEIAVLNGILALGSVDSSKFIPDAIKAIADNFALIDPSPAATLIEKTVTANGTYNATSDSANGYSSATVNVSATPIAGYEETKDLDLTFSRGETVTYYVVSRLVEGSYIIAFTDSTESDDTILTTVNITP